MVPRRRPNLRSFCEFRCATLYHKKFSSLGAGKPGVMSKKGMGRTFIFLISVLIVLLSSAFSTFIYYESGENHYSILWSVYAFGCVFLAGIFALYPGGKKKYNEWGEPVKVGGVNNLSYSQSFAIFGWVVIFGLLLVYVTQFRNNS